MPEDTPKTLPPAEIWGRVAMLMARNLPKGFNQDKALGMWEANPQAAFIFLGRNVRWSRPKPTQIGEGEWRTLPETRDRLARPRRTCLPTDEDQCSELLAQLDTKDAPPPRAMTTLEREQFWRGTFAVDASIFFCCCACFCLFFLPPIRHLPRHCPQPPSQTYGSFPAGGSTWER
ncbi:hypothetical protein [Nonomuraea basaltis]|uniref:hypothetical protein n=1 Tax=Nonomuraea basaltis TaxID=2495887 RepID=UPI00110C5203|nr:hypothetical protein [Nonomuraea basaltis]TMR93302.1 hypothetical protein EJK15_40095 [Nonomuraea basaltis]